MNRKIKRYLDEIERTEKKIEELQAYLKGVRVALKAEEENEMIKSIRSMKLNSHELFDLLNGIQDGSISFQVDEESGSNEESGSLFFKENTENGKESDYGEMEKYEKETCGPHYDGRNDAGICYDWPPL